MNQPEQALAVWETQSKRLRSYSQCFFASEKERRLRLDREKYPMTFPMALRLNGVIAQEVAVRKSLGAWLPAVCAQR